MESLYRQPEFAAKNVQWFWVGHLTGYGKGYWRPADNGQLTNEQIFKLLRKYL